MKLVVEEIDGDTNCILRDIPLEVSAASHLGIAEHDFAQTIEIMDYELTPEQVALVSHTFGIQPCAQSNRLRVRLRAAQDELSYKIHTGRELLLMLRNEKPLAYFTYGDKEEFEDVCDQPFLDYVKRGIFCAATFAVRRHNFSVVYQTFSLPEERWRIQSLNLLMLVAQKCAWTEGMERVNGALLGYTEEQADEYIEKIFRRNMQQSFNTGT